MYLDQGMNGDAKVVRMLDKGYEIIGKSNTGAFHICSKTREKALGK